MLNRELGVGLLVALLAGGAVAQSDPPTSVEGRLLQLLRDKGVIDAKEHEELANFERQIREESDIEARLGTRIEELTARLADEGPKTTYKPGKGFGWSTADKKFALNIGGRLQSRFTHEENDDESGNKDGEGEPNFTVARARLIFEGNAFEEYWKYRFQFDLAGDTARGNVGPLALPMGGGSTGTGSFTSGNRLTELKDAYLEFAKWKSFQLRFGQFKVPYSRQEMANVFMSTFVDRAITNRVFATGRESGFMIFGTMGGEKEDLFEYYLGAFNGEGENQNNNDDGLLYAARVAFNPFGAIKYTESDVDHTEDFRVAVAVNAFFHDNDNHSASARFDTWSIGADIAMAWRGFFFTAEFHRREVEQSGSDLEVTGWHAQLGYFLIPHEFVIALRAAEIDWDESATLSGQREYLGLLAYYFAEHHLKLQLDFGRVELHEHDHVRNDDEWRARFQATLIF